MKVDLSDKHLSSQLTESSFLRSQWQKRPLPLQLFLLLCLNLAVAPAVQAAGGVSRGNAYALGLLGLVTLGLAIYLFVVILQPERF